MLTEIERLLESDLKHKAMVLLHSTPQQTRTGTILEADAVGIALLNELDGVHFIPWRSILSIDVIEREA